MKSTGVVPAPAPDAETLIKEARRRQRRRYAATGVAVVAVLAAALGAFAGSHGASKPGQASQPRPRAAAGHSIGPHVPGVHVGEQTLSVQYGSPTGQVPQFSL